MLGRQETAAAPAKLANFLGRSAQTAVAVCWSACKPSDRQQAPPNGPTLDTIPWHLHRPGQLRRRSYSGILAGHIERRRACAGS